MRQVSPLFLLVLSISLSEQNKNIRQFHWRYNQYTMRMRRAPLSNTSMFIPSSPSPDIPGGEKGKQSVRKKLSIEGLTLNLNEDILTVSVSVQPPLGTGTLFADGIDYHCA
jgi:hypothetical protein